MMDLLTIAFVTLLIIVYGTKMFRKKRHLGLSQPPVGNIDDMQLHVNSSAMIISNNPGSSKRKSKTVDVSRVDLFLVNSFSQIYTFFIHRLLNYLR